MNIDEIKAAAERLVFLANQGRPGVYPGLQFARALLAALPVVEAAQTVTRKAIVILDFHEQGTTVELDLVREALAAFVKTIEGMKL